MDDEIAIISPTASFAKRKLLVELPRKSSELLALFGARKSPLSSSRMERQRRATANVSYVESEDSQDSPSPTKSTSSFEDAPVTAQWNVADSNNDGGSATESEDELSSDTIRGVSPSPSHPAESTSTDDLNLVVRRGTATLPQAAESSKNSDGGAIVTRTLPARSSRNAVSHARPTKTYKVSKKSRNSIKKILVSNTLPDSKRVSKAVHETARTRVRSDIAEHTKPKRDAYLLAHQEYFQPLLPDNNQIEKLKRMNDMKDENEPEEVTYVSLSQQPQGVKAVMKPYQLEGLSFLVHMHENGMSAILGDEMGLGKTLQTLSLFQYLAENKPITGENRPHLVVCPLSVLSSWISESKKWVPGLNVIRFHGPKIERERFKLQCLEKKSRYDGGRSENESSDRVDLVVTTYETFTAEHNWFKRAFVWRYCVLDEGHKIKNEKSDISNALQGLSAEYRLLLTGTPLQNNLHEMWALLHWLYPSVFTIDTADNFKKAFDLSKGKASTSFMDDARRLLEIIMLRRMKSSPGVNLGLPPKEEILLYVPLTPMQRFWYTRLLTKADKATLDDLFKGAKDKEEKSLEDEKHDTQLALLEKAGAVVDAAEAADTTDVWAESRTIMEEALAQEQTEQADQKATGWQKLMNLLMQLRKACNHPYLLPNASPDPYYLGEHVKVASGKFIVLDKLLEELVLKQGKKVLIFSGFTRTLDLCEDLMALRGANTFDAPFRYARLDGSTQRAQRNLSIRMFNKMDSEFKVMLLSTRAGGLGINLTSATDVVFMDEDWNPQVTLQAEARAHRIGQTKKVTVYKLCTQGTVEEQMMGRIRKKLYLSAKVMESMRNLHSEGSKVSSKKRKRTTIDSTMAGDDAPQLDAASLQSLIRRGAQTLTRPEIDVTEMLSWDWDTTLEKCKDKPIDTLRDPAETEQTGHIDEQEWLASMEKVECAVFEGKKHQKLVDQQLFSKAQQSLCRADRRDGKNTTVLVDGFMINKESLQCADWEAVPTLAGKDPRLAEPKREKKAAVNNQDFCQSCWDGGDVYMCSGCPRAYHVKCLSKAFQAKAKGWTNFYCPQHECRDCGAKTAEAGGLIYRCRWCENGFCEDCMDWEKTALIGDALPEYEMLGFGPVVQAHYIECSHCVERWAEQPDEKRNVEKQRRAIDREHAKFVAELADVEDGAQRSGAEMTNATTPSTVSEVATPKNEIADHEKPTTKREASSARSSASSGAARKNKKARTSHSDLPDSSKQAKFKRTLADLLRTS